MNSGNKEKKSSIKMERLVDIIDLEIVIQFHILGLSVFLGVLFSLCIWIKDMNAVFLGL